MSGAQRRRRKARRRMAQRVVHEFPVVMREVGSRVLELHGFASIRARSLKTLDGEKMPATAELCDKARALELDLLAAADLLESVFVHRTADPAALDLTTDDLRDRTYQVRGAIAEIRRVAGNGALSAEVDDSAARHVSAAYGIPTHRLAWTRYCRGGGSRGSKTGVRSLALSCLLPVLLLFCACSAPATHDGAAAEPNYFTPPPRIVLMLDKTGSVGHNRVEQPGVDDLTPLFDLLLDFSGELAIGFISDDSNRTLLRLRIDLPPSPPAEPSEGVNAFVRVQLQEQYAEAVAAYDAELEAWSSAMRSRVAEYRRHAAELLARPANAKHTDVFGALARANSFLDEPTPRWAVTSEFVVLISDGDDNVHGEPVSPAPGTNVAIVNGAATLGDLADLEPVMFESVDSALRWVVATAKSSAVTVAGM